MFVGLHIMTAMRFLSLVGNSFGCSASGERLVSAARDGDLQEAKALLDYNPRLARYSTFGVRNSPLHYSASQGHHEIVSLLIESGVDINLRNYRGQTALMQACQYGHWEVVQILILFKANIHKADYLNGGTALHLAALNGHFRCIRLLLADHVPSIPNFSSILRKRSRNDDSITEFDKSALHAIVNRPADGGVTALHMAALNGHVETVHLLLDLGASVSSKTVQDGATIDLIGVGSTPLHYAACGGNAQCCQLLIAKGASLTTKNANGWTPLMVARSWHRDWLENILSQESQSQRKLSPSPYLCLPLMSIVDIARECGWRNNDSSSTCLDPCVVCLERKCTVAAEGCSHEFCTQCALYLCSTNTTSTVTHGPPGSIACPLCRHGIVSFVKLAGTKPMIKEMSRIRSLSFCISTDDPDHTSLEMALCKPNVTSSLDSSFQSIRCHNFPSVKFSPGLCLGAPDASPPMVPRSVDSGSSSRLVGWSRSDLGQSTSQNEGRRWLCSFSQSVQTGSS
ncbi:26S proteasome regulatory complex, subunit PSMD10 [Handroanthus impetiginosus]|uniref:RING-type E3 ubiquitin transferase n=1 Tax=Handroanthus impetiginosus TaxID=429701 RepID=A0A2G9HL19_9LAMI|nr:26S proteasome regulatory complex, subunit PSMD10 [Handroanthus impetiginosus]